jgi:glutamate racemase
MTLLVFDSGIGGLGVVRAMRDLAPREPLIYLADNGFFPYGEKPDEVLLPHIVALIERAVAVLAPRAVVVACNTASTIALPSLRALLNVPVVGCVPPIKPASLASKTQTIGVLATAATVRRPYLSGLIEQFAQGCRVLSLGTPALAELAERKFRGEKVEVGEIIAPLFAQDGGADIDAVALGCTHYTFLLPAFMAARPGIAWFDPAPAVARQSLRVAAHVAATQSAHAGTAYFTGDVLRAEWLAPFGFTRAETCQW